MSANFGELLNWFNPTNNTPDYYNACVTDPFPSHDVPRHFQGYQYPRTGNGYASGACYLKGVEQRDYIAVELTDTLKKDQYYCVEFYLNLTNISTYAIKEIGAYFSVNNPYQSTIFNLPYIPQVIGNHIYSDTLDWMKIEGYYLASGGEKFITIGNFSTNANTTVDSVSNEWRLVSFYYFDDVSVTECEQPIPPTPVLIQPNVFTPNNDGVNDELKFGNLPELSSFHIYNRWGNLLYEQANYQNNWHADDVSDGVYFYILKLPDGTTKYGTIHIYRNP